MPKGQWWPTELEDAALRYQLPLRESEEYKRQAPNKS